MTLTFDLDTIFKVKGHKEQWQTFSACTTSGLGVYGYNLKFQYLRGDNSHKDSSDPFATNVIKLRYVARINMEKILCRYLLRFIRSIDNKVLGFRGDNSVRDSDRLSLR